MAKGNFITYVVSDNPNKYPNGGEQGGYLYEIVEDVTPEVTAQTPIITQIAENLGVSITTPSGTNKQKLQVNNSNLQSIKDNAKGGFPNGTEWTQSNITNKIINCVRNANGIWVAGGSGIYYSVDGKTWTQSNITSESFSKDCIFYAKGLWVAAAEYGIYYSVDGKTWTKSNIDSSKRIRALCVYYGSGLWIVSGVYVGYYSTDGKTWTQFVKTFNKVGYHDGLWIAGGNSNTESGLFYSTDGKTWTQSNITNGSLYCIYHKDGIFISVGSGGIYYSTDGKTWTNVFSYTSFECIHNGNGLWVVGGDNISSLSGIYYSINGESWTRSNITGEIIYCVRNANGIWVAGSGYDKGLYYSLDGKTWVESNIINGYFYDVCNANGIWVACGDSDHGLYYSETWEAV